MTTPIEVLNHRLTFAIGMIALFGAGMTFLDTRHASASDVQEIVEAIKLDQLDRLEFEISESERRAGRITRIPEGQRTNWNKQDLEDAIIQKQRYLRRLERLKE